MKYASMPLKKILCLLLTVCLLLPPSARAAADSGIALVRVPFCALAKEDSNSVALLKTATGYYISLEEARRLGGFTSCDSGQFGRYTFTAGAVSRSVYTQGMDSFGYDGVTYYALEPLMEALDVFVCYSDDGMLYYNSVPENIFQLLASAEEILARQNGSRAYSADPLGDTLILGTLSYAVGFLYNSITKLRVNSLWGGAYREDIEGLARDLMMPMDNKKNVLDLIESANKGLNNIAGHLLSMQEVYEKTKELITDGEIPEGSDPFFFGQAGTWGLRESAEAIKAINGSDLVALKDWISVLSYATSAASASSVYVNAMHNVMEAASPKQRAVYPVMTSEAIRVSDFYLSYMQDNAGGRIEGVFEKYGSIIFENAGKALAKEAIKETVYAGLFSPLATLTLGVIALCANTLWDCSDRVKAVMSARRLDGFQELLLDIYDDHVSSGMTGGDAIIARDAMILYLRCAWNGYNYFKFDEDIASAIGMMQDNITARMAEIFAYTDGMFRSVPNTVPIPAGALAEIDPMSGEAVWHVSEEGESTPEDNNTDEFRLVREEYYSDGRMTSYREYDYSYGRLDCVNEYSESGAYLGMVWYVYGVDGRVAREEYYSAGSLDCSYNEYTYDNNGVLSSQRDGMSYDRTDEVFCTTTYAYKNGLLTTAYYHFTDAYDAYREYQYDTARKLVCDEYYYEYSNAPVTRTYYEYDSLGRETQRTVLNADGQVESRVVSEYDRNGNLTVEHYSDLWTDSYIYYIYGPASDM